MARTTFVLTFLHFLIFNSFSQGELLINAGGPGFPCSSNPANVFTRGSGVRRDTGRWASKRSTYYRRSFPLNLPPRAALFYSHRYALKGDLVYTLPVPNGRFEANLYFAENWKGARQSTRQFYVMINGKRITSAGPLGLMDVFRRIGYGMPLTIPGGVTDVQDEKLVIRLKRVRGKNSPMISGIQVFATNKKQASSKNLNPEALVGQEGVVRSKCKKPQSEEKRRCVAELELTEIAFLKTSPSRNIVYRAVLDDFTSPPTLFPNIPVRYFGKSGVIRNYDTHKYSTPLCGFCEKRRGQKP